MRVREKNAAGSKAIEIRCDRLRISAHAADPVVEIVHRDEEDVGLLLILSARGKQSREDQSSDCENVVKTGHWLRYLIQE